MILSHKIRLSPTLGQTAYFWQACGVSRFAYNWALSEWEKLHSKNEKVNGRILKKKFNAIKKKEYPWSREVHRDCTARSFDDIQAAFSAFFRRIKRKDKPGYPTFKKKGRSKDSFYIANDQFEIHGRKIRIPSLGWVGMREDLRFKGKIMSATVSRTADYWFVSVTVDTKVSSKPPKTKGVVGVDLGISAFATLSNGRKIKHSERMGRVEGGIMRSQQSLSRKQKGSSNRRKAIVRLARKHYKLACLRSDTIHKATVDLVDNYSVIVIEDLNVKGMLRNRRLSRSISSQGWFEFRRQLEYKCRMYGRKLVVADRWFPSTKTCSSCGQVRKIGLSERTYKCECGLEIDRDLNAARNLQQLGATCPDVMPVETGALAGAFSGETIVCEAGTNHMKLGRSLSQAFESRRPPT